MYRTLAQHPAILKPVRHKGVHYFDVAYERSLGWYRGHFALERQARAAGVRSGQPTLSFESSPYYMFHPLAADRIAADLPGIKLIVLIRDPVERAYSAHAHEFARGYETEPFQRALELEEIRTTGEVERILADPGYESHAHRHQAYIARGEYVTHLRRLDRTFGRDRLHVVDSHRLFAQPEVVWAETLDFLGLPPMGQPSFEQHNARERNPMPSSLRTRLTEHFEPYDTELTAWLGWVPTWRQ
jgi:hypothetical protein